MSSPTDIFESLSGPALPIRHLATFVFGVSGAIFVVVASLIAIAIVRFRSRKSDEGREPAQIYGSNRLETAWTVVPMLIVLVLALTGARVVQALQDPRRPAGALDVTIVGHQWWWEVRYPSLGIVTANELHVPVSDPLAATPTATWLELTSADVVHSFWVPRLAGKTDLIPNRTNHAWIAPDAPGLYLGQCAEFCGVQHAKMLLRVYAHSREDFQRWVKAQAPSPPAARTPGRRVFESNGCINCHALGGTIANGRYAPDLTHLMSRATLASGAALNTPANLRQWLRQPDAIKPGAHMPAMQLGDQELDQLTAYLLTLQ